MACTNGSSSALVPSSKLAVLASVIAAFFYLRVIVLMYMQDPQDEAAPERAQ